MSADHINGLEESNGEDSSASCDSAGEMRQESQVPQAVDHRAVSIHCHYVYSGNRPLLARVAIVNYTGDFPGTPYDPDTLLHAVVMPTAMVTDPRTAITGLTLADLTTAPAEPFHAVRSRVASVLRGRVLIGHCVWNCLRMLELQHPWVDVRDLALYSPFVTALELPRGQYAPLDVLCEEYLQTALSGDVIIAAEQQMALYKQVEVLWEQAMQQGPWPTLDPPQSFGYYYT